MRLNVSSPLLYLSRMIAQASVQEVIQRADIVEIVGNAVRLKKRGSNYLANCPFHNEKTPSFSVSAAKGFFKCFGCGKGGNVVTFVEEYEKLSFPEAIRWLADYYKIELQETERSPEQLESQKTEESLRILNEYATQFFNETLKESEEGKAVGLSYFKQRGLRLETIETFRLGYCPDAGDVFYRAAKGKGYSGELLEKSGLTRERNGAHWDNYRGRVTFPIQGNTGRVLGFGARILKSNDKAPKYINTPENELYVKSRVLYGLYQARQAIGKADECYLVEGYLDVISLHQAGIQHVVASSGTALTEEQLRAIGHLTKNLTILYDSDVAGIKAALRGLDMALSQSFNVQLALLPAGEDPDSFVQAKGAGGFEEYIRANKRDVISFRVELGMKDAGGDPVKKNKLVNEVAETIARINKAEDFTLQQHYIREAARRLDINEGGMVTLVNKYLRERLDTESRQRRKEDPLPDVPTGSEAQPDLQNAVVEAQISMQEQQEWALIRLLLENGSAPYEGAGTVADFAAQCVDPALIETQLAKTMWDAWYDYRLKFGSAPDTSFFVSHADAAIARRTADLLGRKDEVSQNWKEMHDISPLHGTTEITFNEGSILTKEMFGYEKDDDFFYERMNGDSTLAYFELKKMKAMQAELNKRIGEEKEASRLLKLIQLYLQLKKNEHEILRKSGTVIVKGS